MLFTADLVRGQLYAVLTDSSALLTSQKKKEKAKSEISLQPTTSLYVLANTICVDEILDLLPSQNESINVFFLYILYHNCLSLITQPSSKRAASAVQIC